MDILRKLFFVPIRYILVALPLCGFCGEKHCNDRYIFGDLDFIKQVLQVSYAPAEWKKKFSDWDLEEEIAKAKSIITSSNKNSIKDHQRVIKNFLKSMKDYHVSASFYSTERAALPFRVKGANGRYFFSYINRSKLSPNVFSFSEGDELVLFNDRPVKEVIDEILEEEINSNEGTDKALAEIYLTNRSGSLGHVVPKGPITITVRQNGSSKLSSYQLMWIYKPEQITQPIKSIKKQPPKANSHKYPPLKKHSVGKHPLFQKLLFAPQFDDLKMEDGDGSPSEIIGSRISFLPTLGKIWWKSSDDCIFHAYLFETPEHKLVGYVRIPSYSADDPDDVSEYLQGVSEFSSIISFLQDRSEALIIDQVDNPGGNVFYLYALTSLLTDSPLKTPRHRISITQKDVFQAIRYIPELEKVKSDAEAQYVLEGETFYGIPVTFQMSQFFLNFFHFIVDEWNAGRHLTSPFYLYGIDHILPNPFTHYTKPILVLVNSMDFSAGDFFPAILQDNHRAIILGTRTAGAGGFLGKLKFPNRNGIAEIRYTASIAERVNKSPIENLGVTPDVIYEINENDLQYDYVDYRKIIMNTLMDMMTDS